MENKELLTGDQLVERIEIPAQPELLVSINREAQKEDCNFDAVAQLISNDIGVSSEVLKTVNSPLFGLRQNITSIQQAVGLLGLLRVISLVRDVSLRQSVSKGLHLEKFWNSASRVAATCRLIAHKTQLIDADEAYTFGLFHDAGIPILMQNYADYLQQIGETSLGTNLEATRVEDNVYKVNHAIVGYYLCEKWYLPDHIGKAIFYHHRTFNAFQKKSKAQENNFLLLLAILVLAQHIIALQEQRDTDIEHPEHWTSLQPYLEGIFKYDSEGIQSIISATRTEIEASSS